MSERWSKLMTNVFVGVFVVSLAAIMLSVAARIVLWIWSLGG